MKLKYLLLICCTISSSSLLAQQEVTDNSEKITWLLHTDTAYNFTVKHPSNWEFKLPGTGTRFFVTSYKENEEDDFRENINCIVRKMDQPDFVISSAKEGIITTLTEKMGKFKLLKSEYVKWNNTDALQIDYTCTQLSGGTSYQLHMFQQMAIVKGTLFTLTFTSKTESYEKYIAVVNKVIQSLKVN